MRQSRHAVVAAVNALVLSLFAVVATPALAEVTVDAIGKAQAKANRSPLADSAFRIALMRAAARRIAANAEDGRAILDFYACTAGTPLWVSPKGPTTAVAALVSELDRADEWGLSAKELRVDATLPENASDEVRAEFELSLSQAALKYARHARGGRIADPTTQLASYLDRKPALIDPQTVLASLAATSAPDAYLRALHPRHPQFEKLRQEYLRSRGSADAAVTIPPGPLLRPGDTHAQVALLHKRFGLKPETVDGITRSAEYYDAALADAVRRFQKEKGISSATGTVGSATRSQLNEAIDADASSRILANMEMWRWMPQDLGAFHVAVNVPEFTVRVMKNDAAIHTERVVTGRKETQTPIFSDQMRTVVFQPQWGLPDSIKVNEVLPRLQRGDGLRSGYRMQRNGRDIDPDDVDWDKANILEYHVFQPSGDDNALGQVKFLFPNKHQVYMHDTPSKGLFGEKIRTFSHGCVRVRNPVRLAELVLAEDKGWDKGKVRVELEDKDDNNKVALDRKVPVHITYFTAAVDDAGKLQTFKDVYGHETRVTLALQGRWKEIAKLPDHLAPVKVVQAENSTKARQQAANDDSATRRTRARIASNDDDWTPPARRVAPPPPVRVYRAPPPYYGPRYGLGRSYSPGPKGFLQQLFGGGN